VVGLGFGVAVVGVVVVGVVVVGVVVVGVVVVGFVVVGVVVVGVVDVGAVVVGAVVAAGDVVALVIVGVGVGVCVGVGRFGTDTVALTSRVRLGIPIELVTITESSGPPPAVVSRVVVTRTKVTFARFAALRPVLAAKALPAASMYWKKGVVGVREKPLAMSLVETVPLNW